MQITGNYCVSFLKCNFQIKSLVRILNLVSDILVFMVVFSDDAYIKPGLARW